MKLTILTLLCLSLNAYAGNGCQKTVKSIMKSMVAQSTREDQSQIEIQLSELTGEEYAVSVKTPQNNYQYITTVSLDSCLIEHICIASEEHSEECAGH